MNTKNTFSICLLVATASSFLSSSLDAQQPTGWKAHDKNRPQPKVVDPGEATLPASVPSDAVVIFGGEDLSNFDGPNGKEPKWVVKDGVMESVAGAGFVYTKEKFGDCQIHIEWASPTTVKGNGQGRGNSGVFLPGGFEIQVLDSFENETYADGGAASIYGQYPPLVNASRGPGQWQSYDIVYHMPRFDENQKQVSPAIITVLHNGVVVQHATEALGPTSWVHHKQMNPGLTEGVIGFQDHGNPVRFRNIWVRKLDTAATAGTYPESREFTEEEIKKFVGKYDRNHEVKLKDGKLWLHTLNQDLELVAYSDDTYGAKETAGPISFDTDDDGNVSALKFRFDAGWNGKFDRKE
ncbi:family 16 glycoside hydrolase [Mariniblastus fucicola]|uniref:family 16 glycoside hydrolase n=1 Tax=Mariniblastus fucicola TaxID=980251 RepID=UPI00192E6948|nr:family 16 glycoside hydrolase [Mariniblastus fucicola]